MTTHTLTPSALSNSPDPTLLSAEKTDGGLVEKQRKPPIFKMTFTEAERECLLEILKNRIHSFQNLRTMAPFNFGVSEHMRKIDAAANLMRRVTYCVRA